MEFRSSSVCERAIVRYEITYPTATHLHAGAVRCDHGAGGNAGSGIKEARRVLAGPTGGMVNVDVHIPRRCPRRNHHFAQGIAVAKFRAGLAKEHDHASLQTLAVHHQFPTYAANK